MNRIRAVTDTFRELLAWLTLALTASTILYSIAEGKGLWDSFWWSVVTAGTVGYGDQYPTTVGGRIAGVILIAFSVILVSLLTARMSSRLIVNDDAWTDTEQEQIKNDLRAIRDHLGIQKDNP